MQTYDPHKSTNDVRQGNRRRMNLRVLIISLVLIVVLFGGIYFAFMLNTPPTAQ